MNTDLPLLIVRTAPFPFLILCLATLFSVASARAATLYVNAASTNPVPPYAGWPTAAANIQDAVDAAAPGDEIMVTNGVYQTGARAVYGMSNRVAVTKPVTVRSVNGPEVTVINGSGKRCAYLTNGAVLTGFTLTNGATLNSGGGVWCEAVSAVVSNCVLTGNTAAVGGGAVGGTLNNCVLTGNFAWDDDGGGGAYSSMLNNCVVKGNMGYYRGGGAVESTLVNCMVMGNEARYKNGGGTLLCNLTNCTITGNSATYGGGAWGGTLVNCIVAGNLIGGEGAVGAGVAYSLLNNCIVTGNLGGYAGGGAFFSTLNNCTVTGNVAGAGGGVFGGTLNNSIVYFNSAAYGPNWGGDEFVSITFNHSCTTPAPESGVGNITAAPAFMDLAGGNLRLQSNSPCINAGNNAYVTTATDLDGHVRIAGHAVDIGAYEWQGPYLYVSAASTNPIAPYDSWATAAVTIQDAVDAAAPGDEIVVTNGVYQTGARDVYGMSTRVAVSKPVSLRSVNGPDVTSIVGSGPNSPEPVRCVYLTNGAALSGFTLTNGAANGGWYTNSCGGGAWCEGPGAVLSNCVVTGCWSYDDGGGVFGGTLNNCVLTRNDAFYGGGAFSSTLNDCTLSGNWAESGGGAYASTLNHCTITNNAAWDGGGAAQSVLNNCTLTGNRADIGGGVLDCTLTNSTLSGNSAFTGGGAAASTLKNCLVVGNAAGGDYGTGGGVYGGSLYNCTITGNRACGEHSAGGGAYLSALTNCIVYYNTACGFGENYAMVELDYSCTTPDPGSGVGNITNAPLFVDTDGLSNLRLQSNSPCIDAGNNSYVTTSTDLDGHVRIVGGAVDMGAYEWKGRTRYVSVASTNPIAPYSSWTTAAVTIQDAVDATAPGDEIVVTNGVYATGGRPVGGTSLNNRVCVDRAVTLRSVNGPASTWIDGMGNGRCAYLTNGAVLTGFTLTNGVTQFEVESYQDQSGGGVWCESASAVVSNCILTGNAAGHSGGGAYSGTLNQCILMGNWAYYNGGGAYSGTLNDCVLTRNSTVEGYGGGVIASGLNNCALANNEAFYGGGARSSTLTNCTITGNLAWEGDGGGATSSTLFNCALMGNWAWYRGGGASGSMLNNCTVMENSAGEEGGGVSDCAFNNCIIYYNSAPSYPNYYASTMNYSCTTPDPGSGVGNITNAPLFVDTNGWSNLRLQSNSPCINAGNNAYVTAATDLDGLPRIAGGTVDIGAYEFQFPASTISYAWLQQSGLPTDGSADDVDTDHDGHNNWQEWMAGTDPTNALSVLWLASPVITPTNITLTWTSVTNRTYTLEQATNLGGAPAFSVLRSNLAGLPGITSWTDTNAPGSSPRFYQLRVSP